MGIDVNRLVYKAVSELVKGLEELGFWEESGPGDYLVEVYKYLESRDSTTVVVLESMGDSRGYVYLGYLVEVPKGATLKQIIEGLPKEANLYSTESEDGAW